MAKRQTSLNLADFGQSVRTDLARALPQETALRLGRARFVAAVHTRPVRARPWVWATTLGAGAVMAVMILALWQRVPATGFVAAGAPGHVGVTLQSLETSLPLRFAEGSAIDLDPQGQLQVAQFEAKQARVRLSRGRAHVSIRKHQLRHWAVEAGPFRVNVTGTRFSVAWQPEEKRMEVVLHEGQVTVLGGCLAQARMMKAPERFVAHCEPAGAAPVVAPAGVPAADPAIAPAIAPAAPLAPVAHQAEPLGSRDAYAWRALVAQGQYKDALKAAKRVGVQRLCKDAAVEPLQDLADAARLAGDLPTAQRVLQAVRDRFAKTSASALASFQLGRLAFDHEGRYAAAVGHFSRYLREQPQGALVGDAWGRLLESHALMPPSPQAVADAKTYLQRFPHGPFAQVAQRLLQRNTP